MTTFKRSAAAAKLPFAMYRVGGCVRDSLLGVPIHDVDHVVVGATPEQMIAAGFRPVGSDFPVFLDPETQEEYALARTERKNGVGYNGFQVYADPSVTLEEDLFRRDFTINAMAMDEEGNIIDPYNGQDDLQHGILRHVSEAFADDPMRVLRGARFAARYGFKIAPETQQLMQRLVDSGEMENITRERIYVEFTKGFTCAKPSHMLSVLNDVGALPRLFPEADAEQIADSIWYSQLDKLTKIDTSLGWAFLLYKLAPTQLRETGERWRCHKQDIGIVTLLSQMNVAVLEPGSQRVEDLVQFWTMGDARRQWPRFEQALRVLSVERGLDDKAVDILVSRWSAIDGVLRGIEEGAVLKNKLAGEDPRACILRHRVEALNQVSTNGLTP